jgi:hypothetical protein
MAAEEDFGPELIAAAIGEARRGRTAAAGA